jgi:hypothetical protein
MREPWGTKPSSSYVQIPENKTFHPASIWLPGAHTASNGWSCLMESSSRHPARRADSPCPSVDFRATGNERSGRPNRSFFERMSQVASTRDNFPRIHLLLQFHTDAFQVSLARGHTITLRADLYRGVGEAAPLHPASQHLARLAHHFLSFAPDIRNGVIEDIVCKSKQLLWRKSHKYPGGQAIWGSLPTRILLVKATGVTMGFTLNRLSTDFAGEISQGLDVPQDVRGDPNRYPTARRGAVVAAQPARFRHPC